MAQPIPRAARLSEPSLLRCSPQLRPSAQPTAAAASTASALPSAAAVVGCPQRPSKRDRPHGSRPMRRGWGLQNSGRSQETSGGWRPRLQSLQGASSSDGNEKEEARPPTTSSTVPLGPGGVEVRVSETVEIGRFRLELGTRLTNPGYAMSVAKLAAKQLAVSEQQARLVTIIKDAAKREKEPSPWMERITTIAKKGSAFRRLHTDNLRDLVENLLEPNAVKALGNLDWKESTDPKQLRQLMIDALDQWAEQQDRFNEAFEEISTYSQPDCFCAYVTSALNSSSRGDTVSRVITTKVQGPAVPVLRDKARLPEFLADTTAMGDPYRNLQPHEILRECSRITFSLVKMDTLENFCLSIRDEDSASSDKPGLLTCEGGPELYTNLVSAVAEYAENYQHLEGAESTWVPSSGRISLAKLPGASNSHSQDDSQLAHFLRLEGASSASSGKSTDTTDVPEEVIALTTTELTQLRDAVDWSLARFPQLLSLAPAAGPTPAEMPTTRKTKATQQGPILALTAGLALLGGVVYLGLRGGLGLSSAGNRQQEANLPQGPRAAVYLNSPWMAVGNTEMGEERMGQICSAVAEELHTRAASLAKEQGWVAGLADFGVEYQVVVEPGSGRVVGCRPVNGYGSHFYLQLGLKDFVALRGDIDTSCSPAVLKATIGAKALEDGSVVPDVEVRSWGDGDSLRFWGMQPPPAAAGAVLRDTSGDQQADGDDAPAAPYSTTQAS